MSYFNPGRIWEGKTVALLASGESMNQAVADSVRHLPRIAINSTYKLAKDADIVYSGDAPWWYEQKEDLSQLPGLKLTIEYHTGVYPNCPDFVQVLRWGGSHGFDDRPGYIRWGGHSGYQALHLAASLGAKRILLFGYDCHGGHWHGKHAQPLGNPTDKTFRKWVQHFGYIAPELALRGIEVINCTAGSRIVCFPFTITPFRTLKLAA